MKKKKKGVKWSLRVGESKGRRRFYILLGSIVCPPAWSIQECQGGVPQLQTSISLRVGRKAEYFLRVLCTVILSLACCAGKIILSSAATKRPFEEVTCVVFRFCVSLLQTYVSFLKTAQNLYLSCTKVVSMEIYFYLTGGGDFCLCLAVWLPPSAQRLILEALLLSYFGSFRSRSLSHSISPTLRRRRLHSDAITIDEESNSTMAV